MFTDKRRKYATKREYDQARYARAKARKLANQPPDVILSLTNEEKAYIAGLIDGEGSIYMFHAEKRRTCYPAVCIAMTHKGVIEWLQKKGINPKDELINQLSHAEYWVY